MYTTSAFWFWRWWRERGRRMTCLLEASACRATWRATSTAKQSAESSEGAIGWGEEYGKWPFWRGVSLHAAYNARLHWWSGSPQEVPPWRHNTTRLHPHLEYHLNLQLWLIPENCCCSQFSNSVAFDHHMIKLHNQEFQIIQMNTIYASDSHSTKPSFYINQAYGGWVVLYQIKENSW